MNSHLVTVEVSVKSRTNQRVKLDGFSFDKFWLESLDTESVQSRRSVQQHYLALDHFLKHIPAIDEVTKLDGVGHIPMFEAPERIADLIITWVDAHTAPVRQADHRGA